MKNWLVAGVLGLALAGQALGQASRNIQGRAVASVNPRAAVIFSAPQKKSWFQRFFSQPTWDEAVSSCRNPGDVCRLAERYIMYQAEEADRWSTARETWESRRGDCEDFAVLINEMCRQRGWDSRIELYFPADLKEEGHAVVLGRYNGTAWISSLGSYEEIKFPGEEKKIVANELNCDPDELWSCRIKYSDVQRFVRRNHS
jgi:hypothetical protein